MTAFFSFLPSPKPRMAARFLGLLLRLRSGKCGDGEPQTDPETGLRLEASVGAKTICADRSLSSLLLSNDIAI